MGSTQTRRFGRYEIVAELGRGAVGVVYQARDPQIDRLVALKTISLPGLDRQEEQEYRQRFLVEAQAAGRLQHPGIVAIFDVGEDEEKHDPYIVLEYVGGQSLNQILVRDKKIPLRTALQLAEEIAEALDYAHAQGVVHRDIKPANILLTAEGRAKIADFGIAKLNLAQFTLPGRVLGTPAYMAPEQLCGEVADGRSDLFSLGVLLYAMVTGHSPFHGNSATTVCFKVVNRDPVPASAFDLGLPSQLDTVISRALAKDPAERYQTGAELAREVRELRQALTISSTTTSFRAILPSPRTTSSVAIPESGSNNAPAAGLAHAHRMVHTVVKGAAIRDLILGGLLLVALLIVAIPARHVANSDRAVATQESLNPVGAANHDSPANAEKGVVEQNSTNSPAGYRAKGIAHKVPPRRMTPLSAGVSKGVPRARTHPPSNSIVAEESKVTAPPPSSLELAVQHQFKEATLSLWIDDKLALTRSLRGGSQTRLVVFKSVHGNASETLQLPAGDHVIRLRAQSADQSVDLSRTISANFVGGDDKTLHVTFDKHNTTMQLSLQ